MPTFSKVPCPLPGKVVMDPDLLKQLKSKHDSAFRTGGTLRAELTCELLAAFQIGRAESFYRSLRDIGLMVLVSERAICIEAKGLKEGMAIKRNGRPGRIEQILPDLKMSIIYTDGKNPGRQGPISPISVEPDVR